MYYGSSSNRQHMLEMSTIKTTRLTGHRNNTYKVPLVSSPFLVSCGNHLGAILKCLVLCEIIEAKYLPIRAAVAFPIPFFRYIISCPPS